MSGFTAEQIDKLLEPINPRRVLIQQGQSHLAQQDVRAHLTRLFGFGNWKKEILSEELVFEDVLQEKPTDKARYSACYRIRLRLTVRVPGDSWADSWSTDDGATGASYNQPKHGDAHDNAYKNAISYALKRCAIDLGDQFGLSLYNSGQTSAIVGRTLIRPDGTTADSNVDEDLPQQVDMGDESPAETDAPQAEDDPKALVRARIYRAAAKRGMRTNDDIVKDYEKNNGGASIKDASLDDLINYAESLEKAAA